MLFEGLAELHVLLGLHRFSRWKRLIGEICILWMIVGYHERVLIVSSLFLIRPRGHRQLNHVVFGADLWLRSFTILLDCPMLEAMWINLKLIHIEISHFLLVIVNALSQSWYPLILLGLLIGAKIFIHLFWVWYLVMGLPFLILAQCRCKMVWLSIISFGIDLVGASFIDFHLWWILLNMTALAQSLMGDVIFVIIKVLHVQVLLAINFLIAHSSFVVFFFWTDYFNGSWLFAMLLVSWCVWLSRSTSASAVFGSLYALVLSRAGLNLFTNFCAIGCGGIYSLPHIIGEPEGFSI